MKITYYVLTGVAIIAGSLFLVQEVRTAESVWVYGWIGSVVLLGVAAVFGWKAAKR